MKLYNFKKSMGNTEHSFSIGWRIHHLDLYNQLKDICSSKFSASSEKNVDKILAVKEILFPFKNNVEEARQIVESSEDQRSRHIGEMLNAEFEQEEGDQQEIGLMPDEAYEARLPDDSLQKEKDSYSTNDYAIYERLDISNVESMSNMVHNLDKDQRCAFNKVMLFCKRIRAAESNPNVSYPKPPLLMVHGGAGTGKSTLINVITLWAES